MTRLNDAFCHSFACAVREIPNAHPSIAFLFRTWAMPTLVDWLVMSGLVLFWASEMYYIVCAFSLTLTSVAFPFEYSTATEGDMGLFLLAGSPYLGNLDGCFLTFDDWKGFIHFAARATGEIGANRAGTTYRPG